MCRTIAITVACLFSGAPALNTNMMMYHLDAKDAAKNEVSREVPQAFLGTSWNAKIRDIEPNLKLAQQWMSVAASKSSAELKVTASMVVDAKDVPQYYDCGLAMKMAWAEMSRNPCGANALTSSDKMKDMVTKCSQLNYGKRYTESYKALKLDQDNSCGGLKCNPGCLPGVECSRQLVFPFEPTCDRYHIAAAVEDGSISKQASLYAHYASTGMLLVGALSVVFAGSITAAMCLTWKWGKSGDVNSNAQLMYMYNADVP